MGVRKSKLTFTACAVVLGENAGAIGACRWCPSAATPAPTANAGAVDRLPDRPLRHVKRQGVRVCSSHPPPASASPSALPLPRRCEEEELHELAMPFLPVRWPRSLRSVPLSSLSPSPSRLIAAAASRDGEGARRGCGPTRIAAATSGSTRTRRARRSPRRATAVEQPAGSWGADRRGCGRKSEEQSAGSKEGEGAAREEGKEKAAAARGEVRVVLANRSDNI